MPKAVGSTRLQTFEHAYIDSLRSCQTPNTSVQEVDYMGRHTSGRLSPLRPSTTPPLPSTTLHNVCPQASASRPDARKQGWCLGSGRVGLASVGTGSEKRRGGTGLPATLRSFWYSAQPPATLHNSHPNMGFIRDQNFPTGVGLPDRSWGKGGGGREVQTGGSLGHSSSCFCVEFVPFCGARAVLCFRAARNGS